MNPIEKRAAIATIIGNALLFVLKIIVGLTFNTISLISDALNSLTDIISSAAVYLSIKVSHEDPDEKHQYGHTRSQPIAGFVVSIFTCIVGLEILRSSVWRLISKEVGITSNLTIYAVCIVAFVKLLLLWYTHYAYQKTKSIALKASMLDHRNDIFIAIIVFTGLFTFNRGYLFADAFAGIVISFYILYSGYKIARENIDYIMGVAPSEEIFELIETRAMSIKGVLGLNDLRAHMLGTKIECEVHIYVDPKMNVNKAHDIGKRVQYAVEAMDDVQRAYVHIDPFLGKKHKPRTF